jgi:hypothetical protein
MSDRARDDVEKMAEGEGLKTGGDRPVHITHYVAHGSGLAFKELKAYLDSGYMVKQATAAHPEIYSAPLKRYKVAPPERSADLRRITCKECWREIRMLANDRLRKP